MITLRLTLFACIALAAFQVQAKADSQDLATITCGQLHGVANDTTFDPGQIKELVEGLDAACQERGTEAALSVYEDISK